MRSFVLYIKPWFTTSWFTFTSYQVKLNCYVYYKSFQTTDVRIILHEAHKVVSSFRFQLNTTWLLPNIFLWLMISWLQVIFGWWLFFSLPFPKKDLAELRKDMQIFQWKCNNLFLLLTGHKPSYLNVEISFNFYSKR